MALLGSSGTSREAETGTSRANKIISLADVSSFVEDGDTVLVFGLALCAKPMALVRELVRSRRRNLSIISPVGDLDADLMVASGLVSKLLYAYVSLWYFGLAPNFRRASEAGDIEAQEYIANLLDRMLEAGGQGVPCLPVRNPLSDLVTGTSHGRENFRVSQSPFTGEDMLLARALLPDVAFIHAHRADQDGNVQYEGPYSHFGERMLARKTVVSVEEIVSREALRRNPNATTIPSLYVDAVVEAPFGAHPTACPGYYTLDPWHYREYVDLAEESNTAEYVRQYIDSAPSLGDYLEKVGLKRLLALRRLSLETTEISVSSYDPRKEWAAVEPVSSGWVQE